MAYKYRMRMRGWSLIQVDMNITPHARELQSIHWLPVRRLVKFKMCVQGTKRLSTSIPGWGLQAGQRWQILWQQKSR